jgi:hypothetical protein
MSVSSFSFRGACEAAGLQVVNNKCIRTFIIFMHVGQLVPLTFKACK